MKYVVHLKEKLTLGTIYEWPAADCIDFTVSLQIYRASEPCKLSEIILLGDFNLDHLNSNNIA